MFTCISSCFFLLWHSVFPALLLFTIFLHFYTHFIFPCVLLESKSFANLLCEDSWSSLFHGGAVSRGHADLDGCHSNGRWGLHAVYDLRACRMKSACNKRRSGRTHLTGLFYCRIMSHFISNFGHNWLNSVNWTKKELDACGLIIIYYCGTEGHRERENILCIIEIQNTYKAHSFQHFISIICSICIYIFLHF